MNGTPKKRRVALTVDVEAHPIRAARDHVNRLIWGRQNGREAGIQTMMDIADKHGVPMTFFLDYPEAELYGEDLLDVGREIHRRGHDLEPHCHTEYLMKPLFGLENPLAVRVTRADFSQALKIVDYLLERHVQLTGRQPLAHRSGAYMLGPNYLDALRQRGFHLDASYNPLCTEDPMQLGLYAAFRWQNGLRELPVPIVPFFRMAPRLVPWNFNVPCFVRGTQQENLQGHQDFLKAWFTRYGDAAAPTLVMHSWSFWKADAKGFFSDPDDKAMELFDELLATLKQDYDIVSAGGIAGEEQEPPGALEKVAPEIFAVHCPVCFEPVSHFQDYNASKRQCPFCGSLERHRTLVDLVYEGAFGPGIFRNKDILHIAPGRPERLLLRRMAGARITTLNILPGCDVQADISAMPEVADDSYDIVLASEVFRHVKNFDAALAEIARVLRPGGLLFCSDCLEHADYGREITDIDEQISWYGQEKLEKYGIGDFRRFGRKDWEKAFKPYFYTRLFKVNDQATGAPAWWMACTPRPEEVPPCAHPAEPVLGSAILRSNAGRIFFDAEHDPLPKFLPDFRGWRHYRQTFVPDDLTWLKKAIFALHFMPITVLQWDEQQKADFPPAYPADFHPYQFQSFGYLLPGLPQEPTCGDSPQLRYLVSEIERWIDVYGFYAQSVHMDRHTRQMVWHDSAVAIRCNFMSYVLLRILPLPQYDDALLEKVFRAALDHFLLLCADHFFIKRYNHGLLQILGLLAFASAWTGLNGAQSIMSLVEVQLKTVLKYMVGPDGVVREHSPEYQAVTLSLLADMASLGATDASFSQLLRAQMDNIRSSFAHFIRPNGSMAPFGDTPPSRSPVVGEEVSHARALCAELPSLMLFPESGYAFLRIRPAGVPHSEASYLALQGAFHSMTHKHCDELGFVWSEGKQDILVDSGQQYGFEGKLHSGPLFEKGFYHSVPNRVYSESVHAHNCVEINGDCYSRRIKPYGALPLSGERLAENYWLLQGQWQRPEGFLQKRWLVFSPGRWLLVMDDLKPQQDRELSATKFSQWFHFDASITLFSRTDASACLVLPNQSHLYCQNLTTGQMGLHKGEFAPRLQGWQATESIYWLNPAWAFGVHQTGSGASFRTLFSFVGPCAEFKNHGSRYTLQFANGNTDIFSLDKIEKADSDDELSFTRLRQSFCISDIQRDCLGADATMPQQVRFLRQGPKWAYQCDHEPR